MLVLTRRPHQSIMIGDDIVVTVLEVKGDQIRLGISAPRDVQVHREEVLIALQEANRAALLPTDSHAGPVPAPRPEAPTRASGPLPAPPARRTSSGAPLRSVARPHRSPRSAA